MFYGVLNTPLERIRLKATTGRNIHKKTPEMESVFNKTTGLKGKKNLQHGCIRMFFEIFKNTYFEEHLLTAA